MKVEENHNRKFFIVQQILSFYDTTILTNVSLNTTALFVNKIPSSLFIFQYYKC